jgi:hypothetical protein
VGSRNGRVLGAVPTSPDSALPADPPTTTESITSAHAPTWRPSPSTPSASAIDSAADGRCAFWPVGAPWAAIAGRPDHRCRRRGSGRRPVAMRRYDVAASDCNDATVPPRHCEERQKALLSPPVRVRAEAAGPRSRGSAGTHRCYVVGAERLRTGPRRAPCIRRNKYATPLLFPAPGRQESSPSRSGRLGYGGTRSWQEARVSPHGGASAPLFTRWLHRTPNRQGDPPCSRTRPSSCCRPAPS